MEVVFKKLILLLYATAPKSSGNDHTHDEKCDPDSVNIIVPRLVV